MENKKFLDRELSMREFRALLGGVFSILLIMIIISLSLTEFWTMACIFYTVLCFVAGMLGRDRKIGFTASYAIALALSPMIGFIVALSSPRTK